MINLVEATNDCAPDSALSRNYCAPEPASSFTATRFPFTESFFTLHADISLTIAAFSFDVQREG